jgi:hypothetical protein
VTSLVDYTHIEDTFEGEKAELPRGSDRTRRCANAMISRASSQNPTVYDRFTAAIAPYPRFGCRRFRQKGLP